MQPQDSFVAKQISEEIYQLRGRLSTTLEWVEGLAATSLDARQRHFVDEIMAETKATSIEIAILAERAGYIVDLIDEPKTLLEIVADIARLEHQPERLARLEQRRVRLASL